MGSEREDTFVVLDLGKKLQADLNACCKRTLALVPPRGAKLRILILGATAVLAWIAASLTVSDDGGEVTPEDGPPDDAIWLAAFLLARTLTGHTNPEQAFEDFKQFFGREMTDGR